MNSQEQIATLLESLRNFFTTNGAEVTLMAPFIAKPEEVPDHIKEISGIITVSGKSNGIIVISAPRSILADLLAREGSSCITEDMLLDKAKETANIVAGGGRKNFGKNFGISLPVAVTGVISSDYLKDNLVYVIRAVWKEREAAMLIALDTITS